MNRVAEGLAWVQSLGPALFTTPVFFLLAALLGWSLTRTLRALRFHSLPERLLFYAVIGAVAYSWIGTILAAAGLFRWPLVLIAVAAPGLAPLALRFVIDRGGRSARGASPVTDVADLEQAPPPERAAQPERTPPLAVGLVCALLVGAVWLYSRTAESFFLVDDSAVYTIGSVVLSRTGQLVAEPDVFWQTTEDFSRTFMVLDAGLLPTRHFGPFYQWLGYIPSVTIGYLPLPKVWMASNAWLVGAEHATGAAAFFGVLGLALLYTLVRRALGWATGLLGLLFLGLSLPQIWFARYPLSEIFTQALLLGGVYLAMLARAHADGPRMTPASRQLAFWSALALATMTILRFEGLLLLLVLGVLLLLAWHQGGRDRVGLQRTWLITLAVAAGYGLLISVSVARHYFFGQTLGTLTPQLTRAMLVAVTAGLALAVWTLTTRRVWWKWPLEHANRILGLAVAALLASWIGLTAWHAVNGGWESTLASWLADYLTAPGLLIAAIGLGLILWHEVQARENPELLGLIGLGLFFLLTFTAKPAVNPVQPWGMRRMIPTVWPMLALGAAAGITLLASRAARLLKRADHRRIVTFAFAAVATLSAAILTFGIGRISYPLWRHQELQGFFASAQAVAAALPDDAVLLFDKGLVGERLTQVFEYVFGRTALSIRIEDIPTSDSELDALVAAAREHQRPVFLVLTGGDLAWWPEQYALVDAGVRQIRSTALAQVKGRPPNATDVTPFALRLEFYEIKRAVEVATTEALPEAIPIGPGSYPYLREGFRPWNLDAQGNPTRWTDGDALVVAPWPADDVTEPASLCLQLTVAGGRDRSSDPALLVVEAEDESVYKGQLEPGFTQQTLKLPVSLVTNHNQAGLELRLKSNTWRPNGGDPVGVLIHDLELLPYVDCGP